MLSVKLQVFELELIFSSCTCKLTLTNPDFFFVYFFTIL
uniref:Starch synthase 3ic/amyloplastic n=1 Tax=Rhizophora mucronata TaxID=61149 RepID=A0A2P2LB30_RHIMU